MSIAKKVVLAYSGGLDTSAIVPWLIENHDCEVIAVVGDVGQGAAELAGVEEKARRSGASQCYVIDLKRAFIEECAWPALMAGAVYEGRYLLGTAIARPILARAQVDVALQTGATALAHGCTGKGNDQVRFECAYAALAPHLDVIAPWRIWDLQSREDLLEYLRERNIECSASLEKIYSRDANLWHCSHEGGELEDPWAAPPEEMWMMTSSPAQAPDTAEEVTIGFESGRPVTIDGVPFAADALVAELNTRAGRHGVGRIDLVENRMVGMKSRGCYETPGGTVLSEALRSLEEIVLDRSTLRFRQQVGLEFAELLYRGQWFSPLREVLSSCAERIAEPLTGEVVVRLFKGTAVSIQRRSERSLYAADYATFGADAVYDQRDAGGFIRLAALPGRIAAGRTKEAVTT